MCLSIHGHLGIRVIIWQCMTHTQRTYHKIIAGDDFVSVSHSRLPVCARATPATTIQHFHANATDEIRWNDYRTVCQRLLALGSLEAPGFSMLPFCAALSSRISLFCFFVCFHFSRAIDRRFVLSVSLHWPCFMHKHIDCENYE